MIGMNLIKHLCLVLFVFVFISANAGIGSATPKAKDSSSYIDITKDWQYIEISGGNQWDGFYKDKTVHLNESFGWEVEYSSPDDEIEVVERVELAGPTKWILSPLDENNLAGVLSKADRIFDQGRVLETRTVWKNTGEAYSSHTVIEDDPEGEVKITVRINDRVVRVYKWHLIPKPRVIPFQ